MKKLAKVLAVVLAIALLACPFASAVSSVVDAGADNDALTVGIVGETDKAVRVTVESKDGFVAAQGWLDVTGVTLDEDKDPGVPDYSVLNGTFEEDEYEPSVDVSLVNGVISFIVTAADSASLAKYAKVVIDIPVILADDFSVTATKFVAGDDIEDKETFIEIGFTDKDGVINTEDPNVQASVTDEDLKPAEPVPDTAITATAAVAIDQKIGFSINLTPSEYAKYDHIEVVGTLKKYNDLYNEFDATPVVNSGDAIVNVSGYDMAYTEFYGVGMFEMGLTSSFVVNCYDADNNLVAYSNTFEFCPETLLLDLYKTNYNKTKQTDKVKNSMRAVADLLVMGGEAQRYFQTYMADDGADILSIDHYNDADNSTYDFVASDNATADATFNYDAITSLEGNLSSFIQNSITKAIAMDTAPVPSYTIKASGTKTNVTISDLSKLVMTVSYTSLYPETELVEEVISGDAWTVSGNYVYCNVNSVRLYDGNKTVSVSCEYDGSIIFTDSISVESMAKANVDSQYSGTASRAVARFEAAIRTYFGTV